MALVALILSVVALTISGFMAFTLTINNAADKVQANLSEPSIGEVPDEHDIYGIGQGDTNGYRH